MHLSVEQASTWQKSDRVDTEQEPEPEQEKRKNLNNVFKAHFRVVGLKKHFLLPAPYSELQLELAAQYALNQLITSGRRSQILGVRKFKCASRFSSIFWQSMMMIMRSQRFLLLVKVHTPAQSNLHHIWLLQRVKVHIWTSFHSFVKELHNELHNQFNCEKQAEEDYADDDVDKQ